jgi:hypothetical protein
MQTFGTRLAGCAVLAAFFAVVACANQAEGDRCDRTNGDNDCESGLRCTPVSSLSGQTTTTKAAICCPENRPASVDACRAVTAGGGFGTGGSSGTGGSPDASTGTGGTPEASTASGGTDSGTRDASPDALP